MSRTRKDRPEWVRHNDVTEKGRYISHDHINAGKSITKRVRVRDENGNKAFTTTTSEVFVGYTAELKSGETVEIHTRSPFVYGNDFAMGHPYHYSNVYRYTRRYETRTYKSATYEYVETGFLPEECTADTPITRETQYGYHRNILCHPDIAYYAHNPYYHNRPEKDERQVYHSAARTKELTVLRKAALLYNGGEEDLWSDDIEDARTRTHHRTGWWD